MPKGIDVAAPGAVGHYTAGRAGWPSRAIWSARGRAGGTRSILQLKKHYKPKKRSNKMSRAASTDAARLDIANWLANEEVVTAPASRQDGGRSQKPEGSPLPAPSATATGAEPVANPDDGANAAPGGTPEPSDESDEQARGSPSPQAKGGAGFTRPTARCASLPVGDRPGGDFRQNDDVLRVVWKEIATQLGGDTEAVKEIKRELAHHGWCDLFVGLARAIDTYGKALDHIPEWIKRQVKEAILNSSMQDERSHVTSAVVDILVDRVWSAFKGAMLGNVPLLSAITREETLRSLRILAVFICPAPEDHPEVREHALKPLGDDIQAMLTAETKARLAKLFDEWTTQHIM